jgi:RNA polymerase sigma factor (sigma-70 family)
MMEALAMANAPASIVLRHIRDLVGVESTSPLSDQQLLQRFRAQRDQAAFEALVRRHGSLVGGVCRRVLGNLHDAEDAFQATFLVLARKAASIHKSESVGGWLYRVAYHVAVKAKSRASSRKEREQQARTSGVMDPLSEVTGRELMSILDEELQRLPERYQAPLVLCHLEGHTRDEAAQRLGWSLGTFKRRLDQARAILRGRLARRGLTLAATLVATDVGQQAGASVVPSVVVSSTARAVLEATIPESVATLADGAIPALLVLKPKVVAGGVLLLAAVLAIGVSIFTRPASARPQSGERAALTVPVPEVNKSTKNDSGKSADKKALTVTGRVLDPDGKPVAKADVALIAWPKLPLRGQREFDALKVVAQARTDAEGRFRLAAPLLSSVQTVVALAPGHALGQERIDRNAEQAEVEIRLHREEPVRGRLVDIQGQPVAGVKVHVVSVSSQKGLWSFLHEPPKDSKAWPAPVTTDAKGRFVLHGLRPDWNITISVRDENRALQELEIKAQDKGKAEEVTLALAPLFVIEGTVTYEDTGKPVASARVMVVASVGPEGGGWRDYESYWKTDAEGHFRAVPAPGDRYTIVAYPPTGEPYLLLRKRVPRPKTGIVKHQVNLKLPRGVVVRGTVTDADSGKLIAGAHVQFEPLPDGNPFYREDVRTQNRYWDQPLVSGPDGKFAITVLPGPGHLLVNGPTLDYLHSVILTKQLYGKGVGPQRRYYADAIVKLNSKPDADPQKVAIKLRRGVTVSGQLLKPDGQPVAKAVLLCQSYLPYNTHLNAVPEMPVGKGKFELPGYDPDEPLPVYFLDAENQLGAMVKFSPKDVNGKAVVKLQPCGSATARFLDAEGKPLANLRPFLMLALNDGASFFNSLDSDKAITDAAFLSSLDRKRHENLRTDAQGRITFPALIPGARFVLTVRTPLGRYADAHKDFVVEAGKTLDLKDITVKEPK